ncbi:hypothetical protein Tco_1116048 [Tanacetum coccineum]
MVVLSTAFGVADTIRSAGIALPPIENHWELIRLAGDGTRTTSEDDDDNRAPKIMGCDTRWGLRTLVVLFSTESFSSPNSIVSQSRGIF